MNQNSAQLWVSESSRPRHTAAVVVVMAVGGALAYGFRHFEGPGLSNSLSGFLLGWLLLAIGIGNLVAGGQQTITVDSRRRQIVIEGKSWLISSRKVIAFMDISRLHVGEFGDREGGSISYHVVLELKTGQSIPLFFAFFDGQYDRLAAQARCDRLAQCLQTHTSFGQ